MSYQRTKAFVRREAVPIRRASVVLGARLAGGCALYVPVALEQSSDFDAKDSDLHAKGNDLYLAVTVDEEGAP